ncbi:TonB-dependent receptor [Phenylobacterium terrae]|uniref:TonB-dependent receptor n=1 Tax=Phenylobacterium terrae TaxID=2665495 RepID=A0ABW4MYI6_9CAUL
MSVSGGILRVVARSGPERLSGARRALRASASLVAIAAAVAAGPALAQDVALSEIVVTGEKTTRSLQDTASSVSVTDGRELERRTDIVTTSDLLSQIPNVVTVEPSNFAPAIRGLDGTGPAQGADAFFAGTRPRLNHQVDGRTLSHNEAIFSDATLWDVERVEVFRGPQSTLQGRNAVAGAVIVKTRDPTFDWSGTARILAGSRDTQQVSGAVGGPLLDDQLAFRLAADWRRSDSFVEFTGYPGIEDPGESESLALRGKLLFTPQALPGFRALLTVSHLDAHEPQTADVTYPFDDHVASYPFQPVFGTRATSAILEASQTFGPGLTFEMLASGTDLRVRRYALPGDGNAEINGEEWVLEPRVRFGAAGDRIRGFVGAHVFKAEQDEYIDLFGGGTFDDSTRTYAAFAEGLVALTPELELTLGGRLEREERERTGGVGPFLIDFDETYEVFLPKASLAWRLSDDVTVGVLASRGYNGGGAGFTYEVPFVSYTYKPEFVWNYEAFARASLAGGRLNLTGNVFYDRYRDIQLPFDLNPDPDLWSYVVRNADEAETLGAEVSARYMAAPGLELFGAVGLLQTEVTEYPNSGIEGHELPRSPSLSFNLGVDYRHESGFEFGADARYSGGYHTAIDNDPRGEVDAFWTANARAAYRVGNVKVFASVANVFDETGPVMLYPGATFFDDSATILTPRTIQVGLQADF